MLMTELSPAAQAVLDAFGTYPLRADHISEDLILALAAALRAAADQCAEGATHWELYAIAAELEGHV
jgi:hypothetical protein